MLLVEQSAAQYVATSHVGSALPHLRMNVHVPLQRSTSVVCILMPHRLPYSTHDMPWVHALRVHASSGATCTAHAQRVAGIADDI
eukprot:3575800-Prymnesium_polylepis.1